MKKLESSWKNGISISLFIIILLVILIGIPMLLLKISLLKSAIIGIGGLIIFIGLFLPIFFLYSLFNKICNGSFVLYIGFIIISMMIIFIPIPFLGYSMIGSFTKYISLETKKLIEILTAILIIIFSILMTRNYLRNNVI